MESRYYDYQSEIDLSVLIRDDSIILVYMNDCVIFSKNNSYSSKKLIHSLTHAKEKFEITDEGDVSTYLGVDITKHKDVRIEFIQPH